MMPEEVSQQSMHRHIYHITTVCLQRASGTKWMTSGCEIPILFLSQLFRGVLEINRAPIRFVWRMIRPSAGGPLFQE